MVDDMKVDVGVNTERLNWALRQIKEEFNKGWSQGGEGGAGEARVSELRRLITGLVNQQNIYLRAAERAGRVHSARMAEQERYFEGVAANIRLRAELRDKGGGGGGTPISDMLAGGKSPRELFKGFEKGITDALGEVYEYQQAKEDLNKNAPAVKGALGGLANNPLVEPSKKMGKFAGKMNSVMGGFVKKGGDFFKSSAGKGVMAGGAAGAGMFAIIIKKAIEASPMLQAMLKIMNTAILLFLRPIGDFIGGMLKPIMLFFLKEVAVPMLKAGKGMIKFGEAVGRGILGFMLKPMEVIMKAIVGALSFFPFFGDSAMGQYWSKYEPIADWMLDKRIDTLIAVINSKLPAGVAPITKKDIAQFVAAGGDLEEFSSQMTRGPGGPYGPGQSPSAETLQGFMNLFPEEMAELMRLQAAKVTADYEIIHEKLRAMGIEFGDVVNESSAATEALAALAFVARTGLIPEFSSLAVTVEFLRKAIFQGLMPTWMAKLTEWADEGKITKEELERAMKYMIEQGLHGWSQPLKYIEMSLVDAKDAFGLVAEDAIKVRNHMENTRRYAEAGSDHMSKAANVLLGGYNKVVALIASMTRKSYPIGGSPRPSPGDDDGGSGFTSILSSGQSLESYGAKMKIQSDSSGRRFKSFQHGGLLTEEVWGVGKSGTTYNIGEAGPEMITPVGKSNMGDIIANVTINIDKVLQDVDLEQIKPIIERALLEVHAKRGII